MTIKTDYKCNFTKAENDLFSWDDISPDMVTYKPTGKLIYQMEWYEWKNSQPIADETIKDGVKAFWQELEELRENPDAGLFTGADVANLDIVDEPKDGVNGYCRKCHSYCYGDCDAN